MSDEVSIVDIENPKWVSLNQNFLDMVKRFYDKELSHIASMRYETLVNYIATIVDGICKNKLIGMHDNAIQSKVQAGFLGDTLCGFQVFHMLPNRLPHVQTLNWAYLYSEDPKVTSRLSAEVSRYKEEWKAEYINMTVTSSNRRLHRTMMRTCRNCVTGGTYYITTGIRHSLWKC